MDSDSPSTPPAFAFGFEMALGVAALFLGWLVGHSPIRTMTTAGSWDAWPTVAGWGLAAACPMLVALLVIERLRWAPLAELHEVVERHIVPMFAPLTVIELALLSAAAGLGEELLFRGLLQDGLAAWLGGRYGVWVALAAASFVFGVCHALTSAYAVVATAIGAYLGLLFLHTDHLLAPIIAHAVYDFVALLYLVRWKRN
ncbi:MAG: CPBP family intramembrane metalloprotease [Pirellulaceae bacterium]|jgi:hypothetical protein|nr:CPBP family intramembrane metalloprotease [Pirellulaceae bacterium]